RASEDSSRARCSSVSNRRCWSRSSCQASRRLASSRPSVIASCTWRACSPISSLASSRRSWAMASRISAVGSWGTMVGSLCHRVGGSGIGVDGLPGAFDVAEEVVDFDERRLVVAGVGFDQLALEVVVEGLQARGDVTARLEVQRAGQAGDDGAGLVDRLALACEVGALYAGGGQAHPLAGAAEHQQHQLVRAGVQDGTAGAGLSILVGKGAGGVHGGLFFSGSRTQAESPASCCIRKLEVDCIWAIIESSAVNWRR